VLLPLGEPARVLDRDELPDALDPGLRQHIERACEAVLASADQLRAEIETRSRLIWPRLHELGLR
jgi:predicted RNA-binding protein associated with RNAse of E/G family